MKLLSFSRGLFALLALCLLAVACSGDDSDPAPAVSGNGSADPESAASGGGSADSESASSGGGAGQESAASGGGSADSESASSDGDDSSGSDSSDDGASSSDDGASDGGDDDSDASDDSDDGGASSSDSDDGGTSGASGDGGASTDTPAASTGEEVPVASLPGDPTLPGPYAVGAASAFVRDQSRPFDPWGARYKSPGVQAVIDEVRAAGDPQIVPVEIHYPIEAAPGAAVSLAVQPARVALAADPGAIRATNLDYFHGDRALYDSAFSPQLARFGLPGGVEEAEAQDRRSFLNAPVAEGRFPVVVLSHGLGGSGRQWTAAAEHLASHGYVVASPSYISDSGSPLVFHDPNSAYAASLGSPAAATAAEARFGADQTVFRNFFELGWGVPPPFGPGGLDPSTLTAIDGGAAAAATMMGELFQQRVDDIAAVLGYLDALNAPAADCEARLGPAPTSTDSTGASDRTPRCGAFEGAIDTGRVGVMGHSLGSITSQVASVQIEAVRAVVGLNNGLPSTWEPGGGFPDASGDPDRPDGVTKPIAFLSGAEDDFLNFVFRTVWMDTWTGSGGDLGEMFPLPAEQAVPTADNPLPIVASSYARATGPKINLMAADVNHDMFTDNVGIDIPYSLTVGSSMQGARFPKGAERDDPSFRGESFELLGWAADAEGNQQYLPHQIRNHYAVAMFNTYVKQDPAFAPWLETDRFDAYATTARQNLD